jgi:hypothetical protein
MKNRRRFTNMSIPKIFDGTSARGRKSAALIAVMSLALFFATLPSSLRAQDQGGPQPAQGAQAPPYEQQTPDQLQRLVAPIALYPDSLVAQILAAATFPEQVVEADRWLQSNPNLTGDALAQAADQQPWDPSVKALTAFPSVLGNMDKNISWTSSLGDAYYNQQQDVMNAVQVMRQKAEQAGDLKSGPQETVTTDNGDVEIAPTNPEIVYVPEYDPWDVYGYPIAAWPGWYPYPGIWFDGPYLSWGLGFNIGFFGGFGWGWGHWGFDWRGGYAMYNHGRYYSQSRTFYNRNNFYARGGAGARGGVADRPGGYAGGARAFNGDNRAARGYAPPRGQTGTRSGAFSGYGQGGQARSYSSRGQSSFGGGGARGGGGHAGGGGGHGGGGGRH